MTKIVAELVRQEFGVADEAPNLLELLDPFFPEPTLLPSGFNYFTPDEVRHLDALFTRFGLTLNSQDPRFENLTYLAEMWYRLVNGFGNHILCSYGSPKLFKRTVEGWLPAFRTYLEAVINNDTTTSRKLAAELEIENLDTVMPASLMG